MKATSRLFAHGSSSVPEARESNTECCWNPMSDESYIECRQNSIWNGDCTSAPLNRWYCNDKIKQSLTLSSKIKGRKIFSFHGCFRYMIFWPRWTAKLHLTQGQLKLHCQGHGNHLHKEGGLEKIELQRGWCEKLRYESEPKKNDVGHHKGHEVVG